MLKAYVGLEDDVPRSKLRRMIPSHGVLLTPLKRFPALSVARRCLVCGWCVRVIAASECPSTYTHVWVWATHTHIDQRMLTLSLARSCTHAYTLWGLFDLGAVYIYIHICSTREIERKRKRVKPGLLCSSTDPSTTGPRQDPVFHPEGG